MILPLYLLVLGVLLLGVLAGLGLGWWAGRHHRRRARGRRARPAAGARDRATCARRSRPPSPRRRRRRPAGPGPRRATAGDRAPERAGGAEPSGSPSRDEDPFGRRGRRSPRRPGADRPPRGAVPRRLPRCRRAIIHHPATDRGRRLLLMPAWTRPASISASSWSRSSPTTSRARCPRCSASTCCSTAAPAQSLALLDGTMLTKRRTACASGLAARYLAPHDAARLLMIGTGALAPHLVRVHAKVRPIREVAIWGRRPAQAEALAQRACGVAARRHRPADHGARRHRPQGRGRRSRHRLLRHAVEGAAGRRRLAARGTTYRPGRRLYARDARKRRQGGVARAGLCRHPRRRAEGRRATSSSRSATARSTRTT